MAATYVPAIALPKTWATCSAIGPSALAHRGIVSPSSCVSGASQTDVAIGRLDELRLAEGAALDHVENEAVDLGAYRFDEVEHERLASLRVPTWTIPRPGSSPTAWQARRASASTKYPSP